MAVKLHNVRALYSTPTGELILAADRVISWQKPVRLIALDALLIGRQLDSGSWAIYQFSSGTISKLTTIKDHEIDRVWTQE